MESSEWDGRLAVVVAGDIAVYEEGPARPTGGAGAVAFLVGPDAPLRFVPRTRATHAVDVYDFWKPNLESEYPAVDGKLSQACYLRAVDDCYGRNMKKMEALTHGAPGVGDLLTVSDAYDYFCFHSPYNKLVQQSWNRIVYNDFRRYVDAGVELPAAFDALADFAGLAPEDTYFNRDLDKALRSISAAGYDQLVSPSISMSQAVGNTYAASIFANLLCLVATKRSALVDKRIGVFSYGSGALATMYALEGATPETQTQFTLDRIADTVNLQARLAARTQAPVEEFVEALRLREQSYGRAGVVPVGSLDNLPEQSFYLDRVEDNHNRVYNKL